MVSEIVQIVSVFQVGELLRGIEAYVHLDCLP